MLKRMTSLMVAIICTFTFIFICPIEIKSKELSYFSVSGTRNDPYQIRSKADLQQLSTLVNTPSANDEYKRAYYIQTCDIDLGNVNWRPIGAHWNGKDWASTEKEMRIFMGNYNGNGYSVTGLKVSDGHMYSGLFGRLGASGASASVSNLHVEGIVSPGATYCPDPTLAGGICGECGEGSKISNCSFKGTISGLNPEAVVGGIAGKIYKSGSVENSYFNGTLKNKAEHSTAGIVGKAQITYGYNYISNCYAVGEIIKDNQPVYTAGIIVSSDDSDSKLEVKNCYYSFEKSDIMGTRETSVTADTHSVTNEELKSGVVNYLGDAFTNDTGNINNGYPVGINQVYHLKGLGTLNDPYQISSKEDLFYLADAINFNIGNDSYYIQTSDIDLENEPFTPIGTYTKYNFWPMARGFNISYNGNNKKITNLNIERNGEYVNYNGIFGWIYGETAIVENLSVYGKINCPNGKYTGGIAGEIGYGATIKNCSFNGDICCSVIGGGIVGGTWQGGNIINSYFNGKITSNNTGQTSDASQNDRIGGIIGLINQSDGNNSIAKVQNSYATGKITGGTNPSLNGGIIGEVYNNAYDSSGYTNYYNSNMIKSSASYANCKTVDEKELRSIDSKLGSPFVNNNNENLNNGYPVFEWQTNSIPVKPNVNSGFKGKGTAENPYQISSAKDLNRLAELINDESTNPLFRYAYYVQTNDIDLKNVDFTQIGIYYGSDGNTTSNAIFAGSYDGNYHSITNLNIAYSNDYCGLFGRVGEYNHDNSSCVVKNLSVTGSVECYSDFGKTGGIIGELAYGATVKNCDYHGLISSNGKVGGIVGSVYCGGNIAACYSDANVSTESSDSSTGGIVGEISVGNNAATGSGNAKVESTYFNGTISANNTASTGAICGKVTEAYKKTAAFETNFFLSSSYNGGVANASASGCTKLSAVALKACADMIGSPYIQNNTPGLNNGYPVFEWQSKPYEFLGSGTASDPYQISSKAELEQMRSLVNSDFFNKTYGHAFYKQTADIDLKNENWIPIGIGYGKSGDFDENKVFYGSYDGNGKYIRNLNVDEAVIEAGLFGFVDGAESAKISNLVVYGSVFSASALHGGAVAGKITNNATIDGCGFVGNISLSTDNTATISAGGIVGIITNGGTITNCYHNGKISSSKNAGGILGTAEFTQQGTVTIENSYQANGTISGTEHSSSIVGNCVYANSAKGTVNISNCYCTNDTGTSKSSQNATSDNTLILSKSLLKRAFEDMGGYFVENTDSDLNNGYPVYRWQLFTSTLKGDVNGDGEFNIADVVCLQGWLLADKRVVLNCWKNGDFCADNRIDVFDLCLMKRELIKQMN